MAMVLIRVMVAMVFMALAACSSGPGQPPPVAVTVTIESTGGIAGLRREIAVTSDGTLSVRDLRRKTESSATLTPGQLQEIEQLAAALPETSPAPGPACPDCIVHVITVARGGKPQRIVVPTPPDADSPYRPLLERVLELAGEIAQRQ